MKYKTAARIFGLTETGLMGFVNYSSIISMKHQYDFMQDTFNNPAIPDILKAFYGTGLIINAGFFAISAFGVADGIGSIVKGCPFYLSLKSIVGFKRSAKAKKELEDMLEIRNKLISFKK